MIQRRSRATAALLGLLAIVLGTVGVHRHISVETHGRCEHGAEVHLERVGQAIAPPAAGVGPSVAAPVWWESEGDHHCSVIAPLMADETQVATIAVRAPASVGPAAQLVSRVAIASALFRIAPKTSPPSAPV